MSVVFFSVYMSCMKDWFRVCGAVVAALLLCQCDTLRSDCRAVAEREAQIAQEPGGDYYIGRRYYVPFTRFWGYLRRPGSSWRTARRGENQLNETNEKRGAELVTPERVVGNL